MKYVVTHHAAVIRQLSSFQASQTQTDVELKEKPPQSQRAGLTLIDSTVLFRKEEHRSSDTSALLVQTVFQRKTDHISIWVAIPNLGCLEILKATISHLVKRTILTSAFAPKNYVTAIAARFMTASLYKMYNPFLLYLKIKATKWFDYKGKQWG